MAIYFGDVSLEQGIEMTARPISLSLGMLHCFMYHGQCHNCQHAVCIPSVCPCCKCFAAQDELKRPHTLLKDQMCIIPKAKINELRKSNHAHRHRHTHTLPFFFMPGISIQTNQVQSDHRSKQLQSRPPNTVTQLVCTL